MYLLLQFLLLALAWRSCLGSIFQNDKCETQFVGTRDGNVRNGEGVFHCFKNHVSCIDYDLQVQNENKPKLLVVVAETSAINSTRQLSLDRYLEDTNCTDSQCKLSRDVSDKKHYSVIVINANFTDPPFLEASGEDINYKLELKGCWTTAQKVALFIIIIVPIFAVIALCSCCLIYIRRSEKMKQAAFVGQSDEYNQDADAQLSVPTYMPDQDTQLQMTTVPMSPTSPASPKSAGGASAIPWAEGNTPSSQPLSPNRPRF